MAVFICNDCGFRFESDEGRKCPYCAGRNIEKEKTAEELIESIENLD